MQFNGIHFDEKAIADFCKTNGVARLSLFGSVLRDDFHPESDIDILVEFLPGRTPTLFSIAEMEADLGDLIGRRVDLRTPQELSRFFRDEIIAQARLLHAA